MDFKFHWSQEMNNKHSPSSSALPSHCQCTAIELALSPPSGMTSCNLASHCSSPCQFHGCPRSNPVWDSGIFLALLQMKFWLTSQCLPFLLSFLWMNFSLPKQEEDEGHGHYCTVITRLNLPL